MAVVDLYSKRQKRSRGEVPDVYQYETIPRELRVQVIHILDNVIGQLYPPLVTDGDFDPDFLKFQYQEYSEYMKWVEQYGEWRRYNLKRNYEEVHKVLCQEYGVFTLGNSNDPCESVRNFLSETRETEKAIDVIELSFQHIERCVGRHLHDNKKFLSDGAISDLNYRFREHGVGYQYMSGQIIRVNSQLIHSEVVQPALHILSEPMYTGANAEFLSAHEHYRKGRYKECLNDCLKAFESCIKAICTKRRWQFTDKDTASRLIAIVFDKKLIPTFMQSHFTGLQSTLESGVPTVRNKLSGHGQGAEEVTVPDYIAAYALHLTASNILLLAKADEETK